MTFSTQLKAPESTGAASVGSSQSGPDSTSTLKWIFEGRDGLRAGWRLLIFMAISITLLAAFVVIRSGGVQRLLDDQKKAAQVTVTPLLMGVSEGIAFLIICFAALVMTKIERRKFGEYGLPMSRAFVKDFWKGALWGFLALSGTLLAISLLHGFRITGLALHGKAIVSAVVGWGIAAFDFREGGAYRFAYHVPGASTVIVAGSYSIIKPPSKIVFSWVIEPPDEHAGIESEVSVVITPDDTGSELVIRHEKLGHTDAIERHAAGWRGALDRLTHLLAQEEQHGR